MQVVEIIQQIIAGKRAAGHVPAMALRVRDIMPQFPGSTLELDEQLQAAVDAGHITAHHTATDTAYKTTITTWQS